MMITETERLILRHFHIGDVTALGSIFGDAEVMRFGPGSQTQAWIHDWVKGCLDHYYHDWGFGPWAVMAKKQREMIGYCGLFYFPDIDGRAEIEMGYRLARAHWGHGYATEAAIAVRDYGFNVLSLPRLIALIDPANTDSIRVAEKVGMQYEKDVMFEGYSHPDRLYMIAQH
jgi:RimJ/RimL family protein N-acetyltransferase